MIDKNLEKKSLGLLPSLLFFLLVWLFLVYSLTPSWGSTEDGGINCLRRDGGQETFEWLCADGEIIYLAKSENIKQCFTCFLKKFSDWTWEQEIRKGI